MKTILTNKAKLFITNTTIYICVFLLLTNSKVVTNNINLSLDIFLHNLMPSLYIYILITEILINSNLMYTLSFALDKSLSKIFRIPTHTTFVLIISYLLGYPNAAKCISKLYDEKKISFNLAKKLLAFTNNASPAYILCTIGLGMFNNINIGMLLLISHFVSSIIIGLCHPYTEDIIQQNVVNSNSFCKISSPYQILSTSILNSFKTLGIILGYTILFSLIPNLLVTYINLPILFKGITIGAFELSNGIEILSTITIDSTLLLCTVSFLLSFSSLMIIFQIYTFVLKTNIKIKELIIYKFIHGILSTVITYILLKFNILNIQLVLPSSLNLNKFQTTQFTLNSMYIVIILLTLLILYLTLKKKR